MNVQPSIKKRCSKCRITKRGGKLYVTCKIRNHKQRQG